MAEELPIAETLSLDLQWPANPGKGGNPLIDESVGRFQMLLGDTSVTAYETEKGIKNSYLHVPVYFLVEWLALNWWSFLYEPRKFDREDAEHDFRARHWLGTARNGFALPDVTFSPAGENIEITARSSFLRFAQLNFTSSANALVRREIVRTQFSDFITAVLLRLREKGIQKSAAHEAWELVTSTRQDEETYCRLVGSLGLSPYTAHPEIEASLDKVAQQISDTMLADLCDAASMNNFARAAALADAISRVLAETKPIRVSDLLKEERPLDSTRKAYEWGYQATEAARNAFGIANDDPSGSKVFFERLGIDPTASILGESDAANIAPIVSAAVTREDDVMQISLAGANPAHRKFAAARGSFLAWSKDRKSSRLVTTARTRDQQASRAFAAELLVPAKYLRKRLGNRTEVSPFTLDKISEEMGLAATVVHYQATNHGYYIAEAA
jgi:hypothetical protein